MSDYAFIPGTTKWEKVAQKFHKLKGRKVEVSYASLSQFISALNNSTTITKPIDNIFVVSHSNSFNITIPIIFASGGNNKNYASYDNLCKAAHTTYLNSPFYKVIEIFPGSAMKTRTLSNTPPNGNFHIKGCNAGREKPVLQVCKKALGDSKSVRTVTGPKFFVSYFPFKLRGQLRGVIEYLFYHFVVYSPSQFPSTNTGKIGLAKAFYDKKYKYINGVRITQAEWEALLPRNVNKSINRKRLKILFQPKTASSGVNQRVCGKSYIFIVYGKQPYENYYTATQQPPFAIPNFTSIVHSDIKKRLLLYPFFKSTYCNQNHPFPWYKQRGYNTLDDFIKGYKWEAVPKNNPNKVVGKRYAYQFLIPVTDPINNTLIFNFIPLTKYKASCPERKLLLDTDTRLFQSV